MVLADAPKERHQFPNGDEYVGGWAGGLPEGEGKYVWKDGSWYEGGWKEGAKHGIGMYKWPSGACYRGEWQNGSMQGVGTLEAVDGSKYIGSWLQDMKHGLGKKIYANRDVYEGLWRAGKPEGPGRYVWADGNEYNGEWLCGRMHGQGTFVWKTGERYDGEWKDGLENGVGVFTFRDKTTYHGMWLGGKKHGLGLLCPAETKRSGDGGLPLDPLAPGDLDESAGAGGPDASSSPGPVDGLATIPEASMTTAAAGGVSPLVAPSQPSGTGALKPGSSPKAAHLAPPDGVVAAGSGAAGVGARGGADMFLIKEYNLGRLVRQTCVASADVERVLGLQGAREETRRRRRTMKREAKVAAPIGQTIFKGHPSYDLMISLQLGIRYSVGRVMSSATPGAELAPSAFNEQYNVTFPRGGSSDTPVHPAADFYWKDYAPQAFGKLREQFNIDIGDYLSSICGDQALRQLRSQGKSGSIFWWSSDDRYMIKTMRKGELRLMRELLPQYFTHMMRYPHTLLVHFYGLHRVTPVNGRRVRFVVMANLFNTGLLIHRKYDLKGSLQGRTAGPAASASPTTIFKDLDLDYQFKLEQGWLQRLREQLTADCALLERLHVMDYSLLLGVHLRSREETDKEVDTDTDGEARNFDVTPAPDTRRELKLIEERLAAMSGSLPETASADLMALARQRVLGVAAGGANKLRSATAVLARRPMRSATLRPLAHTEGGTDEIALSLGQARVQLGINMAATAIPIAKDGQGQGPAEDVVLYFGVIDFLQSYNMAKRAENFFKSFAHDRKEISAVDPHMYSSRFQKFLEKVFI